MTAPGYAWVCYKCQAANAAGTSSCTRCGFQAFAAGRDIAGAGVPAETPPASERTVASRLMQVQFVHALLVCGMPFLVGFLQAFPLLTKGWALLVLLWPLWVVRLLRASWRGGWIGIALFVVPTLFWPVAFVVAALVLGARM